MIQIWKVNNNFFTGESKFIEETDKTANDIAIPYLVGYIKGKIDRVNNCWIEGATQAEIDSWNEKQQPSAEQQIETLKKQIATTDYKAIKYAEGWITEADYTPIKAERQVLRDQINALELQLNQKV